MISESIDVTIPATEAAPERAKVRARIVRDSVVKS